MKTYEIHTEDGFYTIEAEPIIEDGRFDTPLGPGGGKYVSGADIDTPVWFTKLDESGEFVTEFQLDFFSIENDKDLLSELLDLLDEDYQTGGFK